MFFIPLKISLFFLLNFCCSILDSINYIADSVLGSPRGTDKGRKESYKVRYLLFPIDDSFLCARVERAKRKRNDPPINTKSHLTQNFAPGANLACGGNRLASDACFVLSFAFCLGGRNKYRQYWLLR